MTDEVTWFLYKSKRHTGRALTIGQRVDLSFFLPQAHFLTNDENRFASIEQIEEFIDDELEMIRKEDD